VLAVLNRIRYQVDSSPTMRKTQLLIYPQYMPGLSHCQGILSNMQKTSIITRVCALRAYIGIDE